MRRYLFIGFLLLAGACRQTPGLPTALPTAALPTIPAETETPLPATRDLRTSTPRPSPTATITPAATATATATPVVAPILSITTPPEGGTLPLGGEAVVSGYGYLSPEMTIKVGLTSATGWNLASAEATAGENGWQATFTVPTSVSGAASLQAVIVTEDGEVVASDTTPVTLRLEGPPEEAYLTLARPAGGTTTVAGHSLFFDGRFQRASGGRLKLAVWMDCETEVADYSFSLRGSTYWQGYVILPEDISGPACAVATVGEPGQEGWVAAQVPITLLREDDEQAIGVMIANPRSDRIVTGGDSLLVNGIAYNAPRDGIQVQVVLANGRIVANTTVQPDFYGYWETTVNLPVDLEGQVVVQAVMGAGDTPVASTQVVFTAVPGSTP